MITGLKDIGIGLKHFIRATRSKLLATLGERAFQAAAPHLWNELPLQLRTIGSVETFKNSIKTFLF